MTCYMCCRLSLSSTETIQKCVTIKCGGNVLLFNICSSANKTGECHRCRGYLTSSQTGNDCKTSLFWSVLNNWNEKSYDFNEYVFTSYIRKIQCIFNYTTSVTVKKCIDACFRNMQKIHWRLRADQNSEGFSLRGFLLSFLHGATQGSEGIDMFKTHPQRYL